MAQIITEVYVSIDGLEYTKLDLYRDESINMKYTQKDLQDLSKIFSPYSQGFTFQATPKNRAAFGFFGDTDVIKINTESKFLAKLYTDGILNESGYIQLSDLAYRNNKPKNFTGSFTTSMTNLKDRIGDDYLSDLTDFPAEVRWNSDNVTSLIGGQKTITVDGIPIKHFVPLISVNRVFGFELSDDSVLLDNIAYDVNSNTHAAIGSFNYIDPSELRPSIFVTTILDFIKKKYSLDIISPIESREEVKDLTVWCNAEKISNYDYKVLPVLKTFGPLGAYDTKNEGGIPDPKKYTISADTTNYTFTVTKRTLPYSNSNEYVEKAFQFRTVFYGVQVTGNIDSATVNLQYVRKSDDVIFKTEQFELVGTNFTCVSQIDDTFFGNIDVLEFYIKVQFSQPTSWSGCNYRIYFRYYDGKTGTLSGKEYAWYYYDNLNNNNSVLIATDNIDLMKSLPKIKVADFLASYFKSFNISVFDTSPNDEKLYWLTPEDIGTSGLSYSKAVVDYTSYIDATSYNKSKPTDYNYYNFKHATSNYFSNNAYQQAFGIEYGQTLYPSTKPTSPVEFKIETEFSIIPPVTVKGCTGLISAYGFSKDTPSVLDTGESRYTPNYDELTVFYLHGGTSMLNCGIVSSRRGANGVWYINGYMKVMPFSKNGKSFAFSVLNEFGTEYTDNLFSRYYAAQTLRLLDPNVLSQSMSFELPPNEIYLNEATTIQGGGATPVGFRLQNDIIVGEYKFSIVDATIDVTTGKTKMTLLNY
jgi:hypothetical protein